MSIAPPSDIVLDVAQAADPQRLKVATAKLSALAAGAPIDFDTALSATRPAPVSTASAAVVVPDDRAHRIERSSGSPYQKFEAMVLQNFVASMLPKNDDLYGDAASADAYRSMMADQLAQAIAKTGRIGIAAAIEKAHGGAVQADTAKAHTAALAARGLQLAAATPLVPPIAASPVAPAAPAPASRPKTGSDA